MGLLRSLVPTNYLGEKEKFFQDSSYNPQFMYHAPVDETKLQEWGSPRENLAQQALQMVAKYPKPTQFFSPSASEQKIIEKVDEYNQIYSFDPALSAVFKPHAAAKCMISQNNVLVFRLPIGYSNEELSGVFYHEVETHLLRRMNHRQQQLIPQTRADEIFRNTEEGLATLHSYLDLPNSFLHRTFTLYLAVYFAQSNSFAETAQKLRDIGVGFDRSWLLAYRAKRGLSDTSRPGGFTKDITYLEGILQVWKWIVVDQHDPKLLYFGRITLEEAQTLDHSLLSQSSILLPTFFSDMRRYYSSLELIGETNEFRKLIW